VETALTWQSLGAPRLHIVDLDGAASGEIENLDIIKQIASTILIPTQVGGGIRQTETVEELLKAGDDHNSANIYVFLLFLVVIDNGFGFADIAASLAIQFVC